ncbi:antibiotic biosynthesis monooxygenase [Acidiferrimicrobium sp. IK]|uniref:putative quinol monooxygenase n=1 Tax=Acidiferrimicrobium sp. IK TaxID=2871700 RepID=UPI0021CB81B7|nr:putative quinol monooxygenase [Acidiferrimicrobium sp. IK]MCU4183525.1 antibiotic biosynthesis monooxygenase [Acidiferrimicrobium sp. IK]
MSVIVVATITPQPGKEAEVEAVFAAAIPTVHQEPGCELYALHRREGALVMIERWADADALQTHSKGPAMAEIGAGLANLVAGRPEITVLEPLPQGDPAKGAL